MVIGTAFLLLALFSIIGIVMSGEDPERSFDPYDNPLFWSSLGRR